jgi:bidirectional [NiFe] hydrogenase diaphorase subunit
MRILIDGKEIPAQPEDTILQAARRADVFIPSLCYSDPTEPTHSCRICMVEVMEGSNERLVASCAYKVKDGMVVVTDTKRLDQVRRTILQLMYAQAPDNPAIVSLMERYHVDREEQFSNKEGQCILCGLCVQTCKKLGSAAISTVNRGTTKEVNTPYGKPAMSCIGCASCANACPTNCIEVEDTEEGRTIWNKKFDWARCERCGAIVGTTKHYALANGSNSIICPDCRQRAITDLFAGTLGE